MRLHAHSTTKSSECASDSCVRAPTVGTQSAVLAGFAYNGIIQVDIPDGANELLSGAWLVTSCCAMGFEMICLVSTSFCVMFGPGLALRGGRRSTAPGPSPSPFTLRFTSPSPFNLHPCTAR